MKITERVVTDQGSQGDPGNVREIEGCQGKQRNVRGFTFGEMSGKMGGVSRDGKEYFCELFLMKFFSNIPDLFISKKLYTRCLENRRVKA